MPVSKGMAHVLLPDPDALCLDYIAVENENIVFHVHTTANTAICPQCSGRSDRVHSHYQRTLQDLPWQGNRVRFLVGVRRFFCDNGACPRKIFAESVPKLAQNLCKYLDW